MDSDVFFREITDKVLALGAYKATVMEVSDVSADESFRKLCEQNVCGNYGKNWACPPDAGEIGALMKELRSYKYILLYQIVGKLEDSFDFEGMMAAAKRHSELVLAVSAYAKTLPLKRCLALGAGGCTVCEKCARKTDEPCRHPDKRIPSLEAYGVNVSKTAEAAGMKYINGQNTVTYFGGVLFDLI